MAFHRNTRASTQCKGAGRRECGTRRDFLRSVAIAGGALAAAPLAHAGDAAGSQDDRAEMCIAKWRAGLDKADPEEMKVAAERVTEQALENIGGAKRFVSRGDVVWIKPNIGFRLGPEFAVNTNPDVVATLVRLCLDAGAKHVKVGDHAAYGAQVTYPVSGIEAAVKAVDGEMVYLDPDRFVDVELEGERLTTWPIHRDIIESDLVINVPVLKQHALTRVSVCMKNYMGVAGNPRYLWHTDLPRCLTDVAAYMKPRLSVVDAVRMLKNGGPSGGDLADVVPMGTVAAGTDVVALEAFGAEMLGCDPSEGKTMANAQRRGLGQIDYRSLRLREAEVS